MQRESRGPKQVEWYQLRGENRALDLEAIKER